MPERLHVCERVAAIPTKRTPLPEMRFLDRTEIAALFARLPREGRQALRDHALLLTLYNTGARMKEIADLRVEHVSLTPPPHVRLRGKGDKWRTCPLWEETARVLRRLLEDRHVSDPSAPVFTSASGRPLTRFGIYKRVRHHGSCSRSQRAIVARPGAPSENGPRYVPSVSSERRRIGVLTPEPPHHDLRNITFTIIRQVTRRPHPTISTSRGDSLQRATY